MPASTPESHTPNSTRYVLGLLTMVYVVNYVDRNLLAILLQSIKEDLQLSDSELGLLSGTAFAQSGKLVLYTSQPNEDAQATADALEQASGVECDE